MIKKLGVINPFNCIAFVLGKLKELLSDELGVAVILQQLSGWVTKYDGRVVDTVCSK